VNGTYYNDNDPYCAQWLRNLIAAGHLPDGEVDERPIQSVSADDLGRFRQCHFFAGIGGWPLALMWAGWSDDREVWTGSCPCQPFSDAGARNGTDDKRNLWPEFARLIGECKPAIIFGEQVASKLGREWLAGVRADLETMGYAVGAGDLCAAGVKAPHIRQRLYWVADTDRERWALATWRSGSTMEDERTESVARHSQRLGDTESEQVRECRQPWELSEAIECADGWRRIKSGLQPVVNGVSNRMGEKHAYGNAIVPQVATEIILAYMECVP
jgi:DNA (cytosine-5)-methyltransferase 1